MRKKILSVLCLFLTMCFMLTGCVYATYLDEDDFETETAKEELESETSETIPDLSETRATEESIEFTSGTTTGDITEAPEIIIETEPESVIDIDGSYTTMEDVSLYIYTYGTLPNNFITKNEARALGWEGGSVERYAPGMCIGGDRFGNYEGILPEVSGRTYYECDINTLGASSRGAERIIYSSDGQIYYTGDHYETFTLLYGEE